jgi:outer membrane protein assembly factor BamB
VTEYIKRWVRRALPLGLVCLLAPAAGAQTILWGSAPADATHPNGRLLKIDYASGSIAATFNGPSGVVIGDGFTGVAVRPSNGQVFVTDGLGTNNVYRIDPNTGTSLGSFVAPTSNQTIDGLEFSGNVLYASSWANSAIYRINPDTGALLGTLPTTLPGNVQGGLTIANDVLYSRGSTGNTTIARRNLATGAVLGEFATPNNEAVRSLATDGMSLYAASDAGRIYRLDLTGAVLDSQTIGVPLDGLGGLVPVPVPEPTGGLLLLAPALLYHRWRRSRSAQETNSAPVATAAGARGPSSN